MRLSIVLAPLSLTAVAAHRSLRARDEGVASLPGPEKFIIEAQPDVSVAELSRKIEANGIKIAKTFESDIFRGLSVESSHDNVDTLQAVAQVARAWPVSRFKIAPIQEEDPLEDVKAVNWSVHWATGVDKLHAAGVFGKGARVAVIDSGIDYNHPALGGGFGPGFKVIGGYDLVGDEYDGSNEKKPKADPMDKIDHGTHVAGIIAGKSDSFVGVAPEATLLAFKVFGAVDGTDEDSLVEATLMAYETGVDVITASISRAAGFSDGPWASVCSRIVDKGVVVTIAAGNDGEIGTFYASSGSSGKNVLAVASMDTGIVPAQPWKATFTTAGASSTTQLGYIPSVNRPLWNITGLPIIPISLDTSVTNDACSLPADTPDLSNAVVLVRKGTCNVYTKQDNVERFGARWVLLYNDDGRPFGTVMTSTRKSQMVFIDNKTGVNIVNAIKSGANVTVDFTNPEDSFWRVSFHDAAAGIPSSYTSWGPTNELEIKPDIAAPGSKIWSTTLGGTYTTYSGTSMACPYVAGVAALYIGKYGGRETHGADFAKQLTERIISSGKSLPWQIFEPQNTPRDFGYIAPVPQVGGGLINATKVLEYTTSLRFERFALNDTNNFSRYQKVDITNNGTDDVVYTFSLEPAGGFNAQGRTPALLGDMLDTQPRTLVPRLSFPTGTFRVKPGQTRRAQFDFMYPEVNDPERFPVYSGKIIIKGSNGERLSVPYAGAAFDLKKNLRRNMFPPGYPYARSGPRSESIDTYNRFRFNTSRAAQDFPKIWVQYRFGVKELRWDIYETTYREQDWKYPPVVGENGYVGSATLSPYAASYSNFDPATMDKERTVPFPLGDIERSDSWNEISQRLWWLGKLANGSYIEPGNYSMRFAARLPFSNPAHSDNWHIWKTPNIEVLPLEG
ncbi:subtilisin-like serine protease [Plectosphaerella plurivora]|uniref:Subtilisin-like serine protease n=1 Tax=Plectosphaerella plurivora TaxID=936078 RepID=A0A9P8V7Y6_9PEZI|nr:subtilisin-like serine protease [Plectosphaerella plurivora]